MSRMLPGIPLWPYGIFSGSTSKVLPLGRNVTLYFFVAGVYLTSSMYGLLPPLFCLPKSRRFFRKNRALQLLNLAEMGRSMLRPYKESHCQQEPDGHGVPCP